MENCWTMEEAKNDFTAVAEAVYAGQPQYVINHSHPDLVIITKSRYEQLEGEKKKENKRFVEFLMSGPKGDIFPDGYAPTEITSENIKF